MRARFGQFLIFIGIILCLIFYASYAGNQPDEDFLGWGVLLVALGGFFVFRFRKPAPPVERFRGIHNYRARQEQRHKEKEEKHKAKEEKKK